MLSTVRCALIGPRHPPGLLAQDRLGRGRVGDVVALRDAARRDRGAARPVTRDLLGSVAAFGHALDVLGRGAERLVLALPAVLEHRLRVGVPARVGRRALTGAAGADPLALPTGRGLRLAALV